MKFDPDSHSILAGYLEEVGKILRRSQVPDAEADGITADLAVQIGSMLEEVGGDVSEDDQIRILRQLDSPESFAKFAESESGAGSAGDRFGSATPSRLSRNPLAVVLIVLVAAVVVIAGWMLALRNQIITADEMVDSSFAQVETVLQRRFDLIPNLVSTVKGFAEQEKEVFTEVTRLRSQWAEAGGRDEQIDAANRLEGALSKLLLVAENYPQLRSSEQFSQLQFQLEGTENRIVVERQRYNTAVRQYNTLVRRFPANLLKFKTKAAYFEAVDGAETPPAVKFD